MDFGQAALLVVIFLGLVAEAKDLVWGTTKQRITILLVNIVGVAAVFLVAESAWGNEQIIGGQQLEHLDWASRILIGVVLGGGASGLWQGFDTLKNIGQNQPTPEQRAALNAASERYAAGQVAPDAGGDAHNGYVFADDVQQQ